MGIPNRFFFEHWPKMGSKRPLASIWGRFWRGLGKVLGGLGGVLGVFWLDFGKVLVKAVEGFGKLKKAKLFTRLSTDALSVPPLGQV